MSREHRESVNTASATVKKGTSDRRKNGKLEAVFQPVFLKIHSRR
jgi:hypothetical protein